MDEVRVIIFTDEKTNTWGFPYSVNVELEFDNLGSLSSVHPLYPSTIQPLLLFHRVRPQ